MTVQCFGFELTVGEAVENAEWRDKQGERHGTITPVSAVGHGYEIEFEVKADAASGEVVPDVTAVSPADGALAEITHKYPLYQPAPESDGMLYHPLRVPDTTTGGRPERRVASEADIAGHSPDFVSEMHTLGIDLLEHRHLVGDVSPQLRDKLCVVVPEDAPLLICAVSIGEKVVPWLRIRK